jgi:selenocysteine lyase/cysteine desulfurase
MVAFVTSALASTSADLSSPVFGHALKADFLFNSSVTMFNHGSYGAVPKKVLSAQYQYVVGVEQFIIDRIDGAWYRDMLLAIRKRVAAYINAPWEDTVLVDNASNAINVIVSGWRFADDEVLLDFSTAYGPFKAYYKWLNATRGIETVTVQITFPVSGPEQIVAALHATLADLKKKGKKPGLCVLSQVTSAPAILLPAKEIISILREEGVPTVLDGAHALGAVPTDLAALGSPDFWMGNAHKWLYAPRSACVLYVSKAFQSAYYPEPTVVDSFGDAFADRFVWSGTRDRSSFLAVSDAMDFREEVGGGGAAGEAATMRYVMDLSRRGANLLAKTWGTGQLAPDSMQGSMANVIVPTTNASSAAAECAKVGSQLKYPHQVEIFAIMQDGLCFLRVMAQIYLELSDYERLASLVNTILGRGQ